MVGGEFDGGDLCVLVVSCEGVTRGMVEGGVPCVRREGGGVPVVPCVTREGGVPVVPCVTV